MFFRMSTDRSSARQAGDALVVAQSQRQIQTFFDELKNGTSNYRTVTSLDAEIAQEYRGRCILKLLRNAHDALAHADPDDARRISFVLSTDPEAVLSVGNSGRPFRREDFDGICQLAQSPKDPNESVGNKGLGFRSVLEVSSCPEIWSVAPAGGGTSFVFRFDPDVAGHVATASREIERHGLGGAVGAGAGCRVPGGFSRGSRVRRPPGWSWRNDSTGCSLYENIEVWRRSGRSSGRPRP